MISQQRFDIVFDDEHDSLTATVVRGALSHAALGEEDDGLEFKLTVWAPDLKLLELPATFYA